MLNDEIKNIELTPIPENLFLLPENVEIKKGQNGYGIFALKNFEPGEVLYIIKSIFLPFEEADRIISFRIPDIDQELSHLVKIHGVNIGGKNKMWEYYGFNSCTNHSCFNNTITFPVKNTVRKVISLRKIEKGDEITENYNLLCWDFGLEGAQNITCNCQFSNCIKEIKGFKYLSQEVQNALLPYIDINLYSQLTESSSSNHVNDQLCIGDTLPC